MVGVIITDQDVADAIGLNANIVQIRSQQSVPSAGQPAPPIQQSAPQVGQTAPHTLQTASAVQSGPTTTPTPAAQGPAAADTDLAAPASPAVAEAAKNIMAGVPGAVVKEVDLGYRTMPEMQATASFVKDFVAPEYIIEGVLQRGRLYTLTAPTGHGKTACSLYLAASIQQGADFCGRETERGAVIYLAGENPDDIRARVIATLEASGISEDVCDIHFIAGTFDIKCDYENLKTAIEYIPNVVLIVIDTFAAYFDGDSENDNAQALAFAQLVRRLTETHDRPAVVMPAHPVKNAVKGNLIPKGGSSLLNEVDGNLALWNDSGVLTLHWQGKFRGPDFETLTMELELYRCEKVQDKKGRIIPTVLAKPVSDERAEELTQNAETDENLTLRSIREYPDFSIAERCKYLFDQGVIRLRVGSKPDGSPSKSTLFRILKSLNASGFIFQVRKGHWVATKQGVAELERIGKREAKGPMTYLGREENEVPWDA